MAMDGAGRSELPTDVLVEILLRLPPMSRRRVRLVCRLWRDIIGEHTTEMQSRPTALLWDTWEAVAYVVGDLSKSSTTNYRELWRRDPARPYIRPSSSLKLIGTCNGLLCLCDNKKAPGGAVTLVNPATDEVLPVPPLPCARSFFLPAKRYTCWENCNWHEAYSFAYHPTSGQYKVVHVPCSIGKAYKFDAMQVLTLGEASWREVPAGPVEGARCDLDAGIVSIDGATYWVIESAGASWVVSFDLDKEEVTRVKGLPTQAVWPDHYNLTEVHGRLGIVLRGRSRATKVWVLDKGRRKWGFEYNLTGHYVPRPHFVYGECILTLDECSICGHNRQKGMWSSSNNTVMVRVSHRPAHGTLLAAIIAGWCQAFSYVETLEPLSTYKLPIVNA